MTYFLYTLFFISCITLIASVLLQPGKTDAGALFTSNVSSAAFGPRGTATILSKITIGAATIFMLSALLLAMPALTGNISVLQTTSESSTDANTNANVAIPANTNVEVPANTDANTATNTSAATNTATNTTTNK